MILGTTLITLPQVMEGRAAGGQGIDHPHAVVSTAESSALLPYRLQARVETPFSATSPTGALGIAASADGRVALVNEANRVQLFDREGRLLNVWGGTGRGDGQFARPRGVAFAPDGTLYVADAGNSRVQQFGADGRFLRSIGGPGIAPGRFDGPLAVDVAPNGTLAVADAGNHRVQLFWPDGQVRGVWGQFGHEPGSFVLLQDVAFLSSGDVCVADSSPFLADNDRIQCFDADGVLLRTWGEPGEAPGRFHAVSGLVAGPDDSLYAVDQVPGRVQHFDRNGTLLETLGPESAPAHTYVWSPFDAALMPDGRLLVLHNFDPITLVSTSLTNARVWGASHPERRHALRSYATMDIAADRQHGIALATYFDVVGFSAAGVPLDEMCLDCGDTVALGPSGVVYSRDQTNTQDRLPAVSRTVLGGEPLSPWPWPKADNGWTSQNLALTTASDGTLYGVELAGNGDDEFGLRVVRFQPDGAATVIARLEPTAVRSRPRLAVNAEGDLYVIERGSPLVRVVSGRTGELLRSWGRRGNAVSDFGPGGVRDITIDGQGHVYTVDSRRGRILVWTRDGAFLGVIGPLRGGIDLGFEWSAIDEIAALPDGTLVGALDSGAVILEPATTRRWRRELYAQPWWSGGLITATTFLGDIDISDWTAILPRDVPRNRFSARFTADVRLGPGDHAVTVEAAGPTRLWIDDRLVIERTGDGPAAQRETTSPGPGVHRVQLDVARPGDTTRLVIVPDNRPAYLPAAWR